MIDYGFIVSHISLLCQIDELRTDLRKSCKANEKKTTLVEELHEKLAKYGEQNSALLESLHEAERREQALRDSLPR